MWNANKIRNVKCVFQYITEIRNLFNTLNAHNNFFLIVKIIVHLMKLIIQAHSALVNSNKIGLKMNRSYVHYLPIQRVHLIYHIS